MKAILETTSLVVATVTQPDDLAVPGSDHGIDADILEYRLDDLVAEENEVRRVIAASEIPSLLTVRRADEGAGTSLTDGERLEIYERFLPHCAIVDTEIVSLRAPSFDGFVEMVHEADALALASSHNFEKFPSRTFLEDMVEEAYAAGADIAKVAVVIETMTDLFALVEIVESQRSLGRLISAMGMGPLGKLSRLVLAKAGSCLNYGYLQTPNAPGQWSADELRGLIRRL